MTELPPDENSSDVDERYRRASSREVGRPSESVRRAVLRHATDLAAERASATRPVDIDFKQRAANQAWLRPAAYGGLTAAVLAGLLIAPRFLTPSSPTQQIARVGPAAPAAEARSASAPPAAPAPAPAPESAPESAIPGGSFAGIVAKRQVAPEVGAGRLAADKSPGAAASSGATNAPRAEQFGALPTDSASALRQAAAFGDLPRLRALLAQKPAIDARDPAGRSALMLAVLYGRADAVELLLTGGADANAADADGTTPLQAALARNRSDIAEALRRAGAH